MYNVLKFQKRTSFSFCTSRSKNKILVKGIYIYQRISLIFKQNFCHDPPPPHKFGKHADSWGWPSNKFTLSGGTSISASSWLANSNIIPFSRSSERSNPWVLIETFFTWNESMATNGINVKCNVIAGVGVGVGVLGCVGAGMCVSMCLLSFFFLIFDEHMSWGHWYPCFGLWWRLLLVSTRFT